MDDKKGPQNGTYTQIPNVFFDTCNLPETAQILYLRLLRELGYKGGAFTGSIRELAKVVRYSKSTTDRLIKVLRDANLIRIEYDSEGNMTIILNTSDLWALNKYHYEVQPSQIWDSKLPTVPEMGQDCPENGTVRASRKRDKNVPDLGRDQAQSQAPKERERKEKERMKESASRNVASENRTSDSTEPSFHSFTHSSLPDFCLEKIEQVAQTCGEDVDEYLEEAEELYQQSNKSEDIFYDLLFNAEAYINRYGPKTMQGFFDNMRKFLKAS